MWFISLVLKNLWRRKVRSFLTCTSMAIAVCAVLSMLGTAEGYEQSFAALFEARDTDLVVIEAGKAQRISSYLDEGLADRIRSIEGVDVVEGTLIDLHSFPTVPVVYVFGLDFNSRLVEDSKRKEGRSLQKGDRRKVGIGKKLAQNLDKKLGDKVELTGGEEFEIVMIYDSYNLLESNGAVIPLIEMQEIMKQPRKVTTFLILLKPDYKAPEKVEAIRKKIEGLREPILTEQAGRVRLKDVIVGETVGKERDASGVEHLVVLERKGKPNPQVIIEDEKGKQLKAYDIPTRAYVAARDGEQVAKGAVIATKTFNIEAQNTRDHIKSNMETQALKGLAWAASVIAVLIGFVSMLNTMMMSITERVREIATFRALGWRKLRIMRMIFLESLVLSSIGAAVGVLLAIPLMEFLANFSMTSSLVVSRLTAEVLTKGLGLGLIAGLLGAIYPAFIAANLSPASALRHE
jgi:ABC-type lipoprotein release transport system permease subunit